MFGLVLEGGGTKGAYHIGAYKAMCDLELPIGCIVGTSIGAVNGALFAQGDYDLAAKVWQEISADDVMSLPEETVETENVFDIRNIQAFMKELKNKKGFDMSPFEKLLRSAVDEEKIRSSHIDFGLTVFNVTDSKGENYFLKNIPRGMLVDYILASACFPIFKPRKIANTVYIDGGVTNNRPMDMIISAGYKDIICVEVGGVGICKRISGAGCNIISVKSGLGSVGTLDFNPEAISEAKALGYLEGMKTFGKLTGEKFYFDTSDYNKSKLRFGSKLLGGIEAAGEIFEVEKLRAYTVDEFINSVMEKFERVQRFDNIIEVLKKSDKEKTAALALAMVNSDAEILESSIVAGLLGNMFDAASAIAYFYPNNKSRGEN